MQDSPAIDRFTGALEWINKTLDMVRDMSSGKR